MLPVQRIADDSATVWPRYARSARLWLALLLVAAILGPLLASTPVAAGVNQWTSIGPDGGSIVALAASPSSPVVYAATAQDVFYSSDGGTSWGRRSSGIEGDPFTVLLDSTNPSTAYVGTREGVFKTTDGGLSWTLSFQGGGFNGTPEAVTIVPSAPATLYILTFFGLYKTTNSGTSWNRISNSSPNGIIEGMVVDPSDPATMYIAHSNGLHKSSDGGANWVSSATGITSDPLWVQAVAVTPSNPQILYASTVFSPTVYKSTDGGANWSDVGTGLSSISVETLTVDPQASETVYAGSASGLYRSTNGGGTWSKLDGGLGNRSVQAFAIGPGTNRYVGTGGDGVYRSADGGTSWSAANNGLHASSVRQLAFGPQNPATLYATSDVGLFTSADRGGSWNRASDVSFFDVFAVNPLNPSVLYAGDDTGLRKSSNGGQSWQMALDRYCINIFVGYLCYSTPISDLVLDPQNSANVYASYAATRREGVYRSTTDGSGWQQKVTGMANSRVLELAIDPQTPATLYAGTEGGVYKTIDSAEHWASANTGMPETAAIAYLEVAPSAPSTLYASDGYRLYRSSDGAASWQELAQPTGATSIGAIMVDPASATTLYVNFSTGVHRSDNGGASWALVGSGLPGRGVSALVLDPANPNLLYAATYASSVQAYEAVARPAISAQPVGSTVAKGGRATLSVAATDVSALAYQWYQGVSGNTSIPVASATSATLTTPPLEASTRYWVRVTNARGVSSDSAAATVTVVAQFTLSVAASVQAGTPLNITIRARDVAGALAPGYRGTVRLSSSDGQATLQPDYTFTPSDGGARSVTVILRGPGPQILTVEDVTAASVRGTATITVSVAPGPGPERPFKAYLPGVSR